MLEISPLEFRFSLDDPTSFPTSFTVKNSGEEPLSLRFYAEPALGLDNPTYGRLAEWIKFSEQSLVLAPNESKAIIFSINPPSTLPAGGQYANLFTEIINEDSNTSGSKLKFTSRSGIKLFAKSNIDPVRTVDFHSPTLPTFLSNQNLSASILAENSGNLDFGVKTNFRVTTLLGKQLYADSVYADLLPESTKEIYQEWSDTPSFGLYNVSFSVRALDTSLSFNRLVLITSPLSVALFFLILVAATLSTIYFTKKHKRSAKKH